MKYLLLLNNAEGDWEAWRRLTAEEAREFRANEMPRWNELFGWIAEQRIEVTGVELQDPAKGRIVRARDGETLVSDGHFAETKELLGGYFLADCKDLDQAIELAQRVPIASKGSVEIRPLVTQ
jgi:hypothetical protein